MINKNKNIGYRIQKIELKQFASVKNKVKGSFISKISNRLEYRILKRMLKIDLKWIK